MAMPPARVSISRSLGLKDIRELYRDSVRRHARCVVLKNARFAGFFDMLGRLHAFSFFSI
jgi:hypothetical protein